MMCIVMKKKKKYCEKKNWKRWLMEKNKKIWLVKQKKLMKLLVNVLKILQKMEIVSE